MHWEPEDFHTIAQEKKWSCTVEEKNDFLLYFALSKKHVHFQNGTKADSIKINKWPMFFIWKAEA